MCCYNNPIDFQSYALIYNRTIPKHFVSIMGLYQLSMFLIRGFYCISKFGQIVIYILYYFKFKRINKSRPKLLPFYNTVIRITLTIAINLINYLI